MGNFGIYSYYRNCRNYDLTGKPPCYDLPKNHGLFSIKAEIQSFSELQSFYLFVIHVKYKN